MARVTRKKKRKARRLYGLVFLIFLSAAAGVGLYKLSPSLLDIGRNFRHAADKILEQSADIASAEPVLRGTVFDRKFREMAVSYRLYSLYVRPAEVVDRVDVVRILADVTGQQKSYLKARLNEAKSIVNVAKHLEQSQVDMIKNAQLPGLYVKPVEERFYPGHETAASLVGFTGNGIGLSGVESLLDILLQDGEFKTDSVSNINFKGEKVLGSAKIDVVLTLDLDMQKHIEEQFKDYLEKNSASKGVALLMDPKSGAVLAWASQPSFNPNYYWQVSNSKRKSLFEESLSPDLLQRLKITIAATLKQGESGNFLLPETVAVENYGLKNKDLEKFEQLVRRPEDNKCLLPTCDPSVASLNPGIKRGSGDLAGPVEWAATAASIVNGGWMVSPFILDAVYEHKKDQMYDRSNNLDKRERILSPAMGVRVRREMTKFFRDKKENMIVHADKLNRVVAREGMSEHVMQEMMFAAMPAKSPEMLLFMVTQQEDLYPMPRNKKSGTALISDFGKNLLKSLYNEEQQNAQQLQQVAMRVPKYPDKANYNQFLISSKIDFQERGGHGSVRGELMPQLVGLSLRKGLQHLNEYKLQVKIQGSGQIVSQVPGPGEPLKGIGECVLTLASEI